MKVTVILRITETDAQNPIRNVKIIMPGGICADNIFERVLNATSCVGSDYLSFEEHSDSILFNPDFLSYVKNFSSIRFMNWMQVNNTSQTSWSENKQLTDFSWSAFGNGTSAPVEVMVALANLTGVDPWFSFPHLTDDDYIRRFAEYVRENLAPNLQSYIEWSNEVWNPEYSQHHFAADRGDALALDPVRWAAQNKYYAKRSVEIFRIWENVYGGTDRFTRVLSSQSVSSFRSNLILEFEEAYKHADALAINPYFFISDPGSQDLQTIDDVFAGITASRQAWTAALDAQAEVAERFSLDLIAYEGGQHLVNRNDERLGNLYIAANRDPRMAEQNTWHMNQWRLSGGQHFVTFTSPDRFSELGTFGAKEYLTQPRSEAPKYDSYRDWIDANPRWW